MLLALLIILYLAILFLELPFLYQKRLYKEIIIFLIVFSLGVYLSLAQFKGKLIFNPIAPLFEVYKLKI
ncbi:hypothetical protein SAMN02745221_00203 [Thermosyntropha lipolytica DSM 11003]|uniref:Uncharacterized protein n=1 Tax=Thermosyntropha lipolytica DSM 11003 TaxID=1123382 RepID=A0A1M5JRU1_9FIRM|nr:hypothetical protein [Thermosyntropha lipolytica]SHG43276.1 hypothetical protein SAMN02745221_00203 [Thermosyntropha lipolytica DSM 11003]